MKITRTGQVPFLVMKDEDTGAEYMIVHSHDDVFWIFKEYGGSSYGPTAHWRELAMYVGPGELAEILTGFVDPKARTDAIFIDGEYHRTYPRKNDNV